MYSVLESVGTVEVAVKRTGNVNCKCMVKYRTVDVQEPGYGTAKPGEDYVPTSGELTLGVGQTSATIEVKIIDDTTFEGNEARKHGSHPCLLWPPMASRMTSADLPCRSVTSPLCPDPPRSPMISPGLRARALRAAHRLLRDHGRAGRRRPRAGHDHRRRPPRR